MLFKKAILAGTIVSIAAYNYYLNFDVLSKFLFSLAFMIIITMQLNLFTGKVAPIMCCGGKFSKKIKDILIILSGNIIACFFFGYLCTILGESRAQELWEIKIQTDLFVVLCKAIIVGVLIQMGALCKNNLIAMGAIVLILELGGEHGVANIVHMFVARDISIRSFIYIFVCIIGNAIGGIIVYLLNRESCSCSEPNNN